MNRVTLRLFITALGCAGATCAARVPARPHLWELRGAVVSAHDTTVDVRHKTGRVVTITLGAQTAYFRDGHPASVQLLDPGRRVRVEIDSSGGVPRARRVHIFGGGPRP